MIVECQSCNTRFQLDDARIPPQGVRVRCSRCKEAFFLPHPASSSPPAEEAPNPGMTQDLTRPATQPVQAAPEDTEPEIDDGDWQFNDDVPGLENDAAPAAPEADSADSDEGIDTTGISDEDVATSISNEESRERLAEPFGDGHIDFGADADPGESIQLDDSSRGDFSADDDPEGDDDALVSRDLMADSGVESSPFGSGLDLADSDASPSTEGSTDAAAVDSGDPAASIDSPDSSPAIAAPESAVDAELDDPSSWDFFASESGEGEGDDTEGSDTAGTGADPAGALEWSDAPESGGKAAANSSFVDAPLDLSGGTGPGIAHYLTSGVGHTLNAVGWVVTLAVTGFALWTAGQVLPTGAHAQSAVEMAIGGMRVEALSARWVDTERIGTVLVVEGALRNPSPSEAVPGMRVEVVLLDAAGEALGRVPISAGVPLTLGGLRSASQSAVRTQRETAANTLAWSPIGGGEVVPFEAIVMDVPYEAARFDVRGAELAADFVPNVPVPLEAELLPRDGGGEPGAAPGIGDLFGQGIAPSAPLIAPASP